MGTRIVLACLLSAALFLVPAGLQAQQPPEPPEPPGSGADNDPVTQAEFNAAIARLEAKIETLVLRLGDQGIGSETAAPASPTAPIPTAPIGPVTRSEVNELWDFVADHDTRLRDIAKKVATPSGQQMYALDIRRQMQTETFREEMAEAVQSSLRREGTLRVENRMVTDQYLRVNGSQHRIPALSTLDVKVSVGTVTTELVGYEAPKHVTVCAPSYLQRLVIAPSPATPVIAGPSYLFEPSYIFDPFVW